MSKRNSWLEVLYGPFKRPDIDLNSAMEDNRRSRSALERCVEEGIRAADELMTAGHRPVHDGSMEKPAATVLATGRRPEERNKAVVVNSQT